MILLRKYVPKAGDDEVEDWYSGLTQKQRADTRVKLDYLRQSITHWIPKRFEHITSGAGKGLGEIKFRFKRVRVRLIGFFGPFGNDFTIVSVEQKARRKLPKHVWKKAQARRELVLNNPGVAHEWQI